MYDPGKKRDFVPFFMKRTCAVGVFVVVKNDISNVRVEWELNDIIFSKGAVQA